MRKVNFCKALVDLKGDTITGQDGEKTAKAMINELLADVLVKAKAEEKASRQLAVAMKIYQSTGEIELEDQDIEMIEKVVKKSSMSVLLEGQIEDILAESK